MNIYLGLSLKMVSQVKVSRTRNNNYTKRAALSIGKPQDAISEGCQRALLFTSPQWPAPCPIPFHCSLPIFMAQSFVKEPKLRKRQQQQPAE